MYVKCLDTYALIEISNGNSNFEKYLSKDIIITELTLIEFYAVILRKYNEQTAEYWFRKLEQYSIKVNKEILKQAIKFRYQNKKTNISFFDAVGYAYSLFRNCKFVTGDKEFKNMKNVEFVK